MHMLLILEENDRPRSPNQYYQVVRAKMPNSEQELELHNVVLKPIIHGPCGSSNWNATYMDNGVCKHDFPKPFSANTMQGSNSYLVYGHRADQPSVLCMRMTRF